MAKLLEKIIDRRAEEVRLSMFDAAARHRTGGRNYLGMSGIGRPCARELWYGFRGYAPTPTEGRLIMLFELGDAVEELVVGYLSEAGYRIEGQQDSFEAHDGWFRGHCDGIIYGVTTQAHVLEIKSANRRRFDAFRSLGVRSVEPTYYCQVQCYMGYAGLDRAIIVVMSKDTSDIHTERIHFNRDNFLSLHRRAAEIISANEPPDRGFSSPEVQECKWCDYRLHCWGDYDGLQKPTCGTCTACSFILTRASCARGNDINSNWSRGCREWMKRLD